MTTVLCCYDCDCSSYCTQSEDIPTGISTLLKYNYTLISRRYFQFVRILSMSGCLDSLIILRIMTLSQECHIAQLHESVQVCFDIYCVRTILASLGE